MMIMNLHPKSVQLFVQDFFFKFFFQLSFFAYKQRRVVVFDCVKLNFSSSHFHSLAILLSVVNVVVWKARLLKFCSVRSNLSKNSSILSDAQIIVG